MAPQAMIDHVETLSCTEKHGVVYHMVRKARVINLTNVTQDYRTLQEALTQVGVPAYGSVPAGAGFESLILVGRSASIVEKEPSCFDVLLEYDHFLNNQDLDTPVGLNGDGLVYGQMRCHVQQKPTNFYSPNPGVGLVGGGVLAGRVQITVSHTFPPTDPKYPNQTVTQGGEVHVTFVGKDFRFTGYKVTDSPKAFVDGIVNRINKVAWLGDPENFWACTDGDYEAVGFVAASGKPRYRFSFEFQYNSDGWNPTAVFIDARTGQPPPNLVLNVGYKTIPYLGTIDFNAYFKAKFAGWGNNAGN